MRLTPLVRGVLFFAVLSILGAISTGASAQRPSNKPAPTPGPMLDEGIVSYDTPDFTLSLVRSSQTVAALKPKGADGFDFSPGDLLTVRSRDGYFHLGDITIRLHAGDSGDWKNYSTSVTRAPVRALPASKNVLAAADLVPTR